jgi:acetylornithine deacetylase
MLESNPAWDPVETLCELILIPSQNPMGQQVSGDEWLEHRISEWLEGRLSGLQGQLHRMQVTGRGANLFLHLPGRPGAKHLLLEAHQDTVPTTGMTIPPFTPAIQGGRVYGRGACDVKGGLAAMLCAVATAATWPVEKRPPLTLCATCDEEYGVLGMQQWMRSWSKQGAFSDGIPMQVDQVIVAEPTSLNVVVAHLGVVRWNVHTHGLSAHSSRPSNGRNAIYRMASLVQWFERQAKELEQLGKRDAWCGEPSMSVGVIGGGVSVNVVPDHCRIEIDRRLIPGEQGAEVWREIQRRLIEDGFSDCTIDPPWCDHGPLTPGDNLAFAKQLLAAASRECENRQLIGVRFGTHATHFARHGIPAVVFGPGSIDQAHTADEWIDIDQLRAATRILISTIARMAQTPSYDGNEKSR